MIKFFKEFVTLLDVGMPFSILGTVAYGAHVYADFFNRQPDASAFLVISLLSFLTGLRRYSIYSQITNHLEKNSWRESDFEKLMGNKSYQHLIGIAAEKTGNLENFLEMKNK